MLHISTTDRLVADKTLKLSVFSLIVIVRAMNAPLMRRLLKLSSVFST